MTLELADGRGELFQWDTGRIVEFGEDAVSQAHFTNTEKVIDIPYTVEVKNRKAAIPDELLQVPGKLIVYAWVSDTNGSYTKVQVNFPVFARPKPSDYVYTPTEHAGFDRLRAEIGDLSALQTDAKENLVAAINEASASGGADWNQNDPTAKDYVKNRPFYTAETQIVASKLNIEVHATYHQTSDEIPPEMLSKFSYAAEGEEPVLLRIGTNEVELQPLGFADGYYRFGYDGEKTGCYRYVGGTDQTIHFDSPTMLQALGITENDVGKSLNFEFLKLKIVQIPGKYISHAFFEIKASSYGNIDEDGRFNVTADKSKKDVWDALKRGEVPYVNFEDAIFLWPTDYGHGATTFISSVPAPNTSVTMTAMMIDGENSIGMRKEFGSSDLYILRAEQGSYGYWYIDGKTTEDWYTKIKENPSGYPILCLYKGTYNVKYEYEGPLFLDSITDTEIVYKRTLEDGNWVGFKLSAVDASPSKNGFIKGVSKELILSSSTADSTKKFKITVDDSGALSAVEVTE